MALYHIVLAAQANGCLNSDAAGGSQEDITVNFRILVSMVPCCQNGRWHYPTNRNIWGGNTSVLDIIYDIALIVLWYIREYLKTNYPIFLTFPKLPALRNSWDRLNFMKEIPLLVREVFYQIGSLICSMSNSKYQPLKKLKINPKFQVNTVIGHWSVPFSYTDISWAFRPDIWTW